MKNVHEKSLELATRYMAETSIEDKTKLLAKINAMHIEGPTYAKYLDILQYMLERFLNFKRTIITNKKKFLALVSNKKADTLERNRERIKSRAMLRESQQIAIKVLTKLDELGWSQKDLANKMEVSPQQITKIVSGKENLTIETQIKLQNILNIPVLASYYESKTTG